MQVDNHVRILDAVRYTPFTEAGVTRVFQIKLSVLLFSASICIFICFLELDEPLQFNFKKIDGLRPTHTIESFCLTN